MDLIVCHTNTDFDGLASLLAAKKLYPDAQVVMPGIPEGNVKHYLTLNRYVLHLTRERDIDLAKVARLIVVDTRSPERLGRVQKVLEKKDLIIHIYDHHPHMPTDLQGEIDEKMDTGATVTGLIEKLKERHTPLTAEEATLLLLGIYEDTGFLSFNETKPADLEMASFLLARGADLRAVTEYINPELSKSQLRFLDKLLHTARTYYINNVKIVISSVTLEKYCPDLAFVAHKLRDLENLNVLFVVARVKNKIYITARSRLDEVNVNEIMQHFGGGGHHWAASASIHPALASATPYLRSGKSGVHGGLLKEIINELKTVLKEKVKRAPSARDFMTTPVRTIDKEVMIEEARKIMLRFNNNCLPVMFDKKLVGIITGYDIDKAVHHGFGKHRVKEYMTSQVITIKPDTSLDRIYEIMIEHDIGHLPVLQRNRLLGMVSRTDLQLLMHHHGLEPKESTAAQSSLKIKTVRKLLATALPKYILELLQKIGQLAEEKRYQAFVVGGFVRDLLLGVENLDLDIVIEGDGIAFAYYFAGMMKALVKSHEKFGTAVVTLPAGFKVDIATARREFYEFPAALPKVEVATIKDDLYRRDFTINAMAVKLNPKEFGHLLDFFGGWNDLKHRKIKVLYNLSFVEDPTRIFRAIRFEQRYGFTIEKDTENFIRQAVNGDLFAQLSYERLRTELVLILNEDNPWPAVRRMTEFNLLKYLYPAIGLAPSAEKMFREMEDNFFLFMLPLEGRKISRWLAYFLILVDELDLPQVGEIITKFKFKKEEADILLGAKTVSAEMQHRLSSQEHLSASQMYEYFMNTPAEVMLYLMVKTKSDLFKKRTADFLNKLSKVKITVTGNDLLKLGFVPGPLFRDILNDVFKQKLEGFLKTKEEEIQFVVDKYRKS